MIKTVQGNIIKADAEAIVNTVNCVGIMGRGVALQFKKAFPNNFKSYEAACKREEVKPGQMFIFDTGSMINPRYIINFPTKRHWKGKSRIEDVEAGLAALVDDVKRLGIKSIAIPPLGCGLGGLDWNVVLPKIKNAFAPLDNQVRVDIYEPSGAPAVEEIAKDKTPPEMTIGRASLLVLMNRYLEAAMDPWVTVLEAQKLMYFMQAAGQGLRLNYVKERYGPYAGNLAHVFKRIEGYFITGYADGGDKPDKSLMVNYDAVHEAEQFIKDDFETMARFEKVTNLIEGFETPYNMELLASVHWVVLNENARNFDAAVTAVHSWNKRKSKFPKEHIEIAYKELNRQGWFGNSDLRLSSRQNQETNQD